MGLSCVLPQMVATLFSNVNYSFLMFNFKVQFGWFAYIQDKVQVLKCFSRKNSKYYPTFLPDRQHRKGHLAWLGFLLSFKFRNLKTRRGGLIYLLLFSLLIVSAGKLGFSTNKRQGMFSRISQSSEAITSAKCKQKPFCIMSIQNVYIID